MRSNNSGCLTAFVASFSRIMLLMYWFARPVQMNAASAHHSPCLGFLFLPFTTLMYVWLMQGCGIQGLDWLWLILAVILDIATIGGAGQPTAIASRRRSWLSNRTRQRAAVRANGVTQPAMAAAGMSTESKPEQTEKTQACQRFNKVSGP